MSFGTVLILVAIGVAAGMLSGFIGVGGGMIVVPALIYFLGLSQFEAQGTSLAMMIPPIGFLGVLNYYKSDAINIKYALIIAVFFVIGAYFGSKITLKLPPAKVKFAFGILMLYVAFRMVWTSGKELFFQHGA